LPLAIPRSRKLSAIALFSALAIILNLVIKVPAPFAPFLTYQLWEVPIFSALLIFGAEVGVAVAVVNLVVLQVIFPGPLPSGPLYNLAAILATMLGVAPVHRLVSRLGRGVVMVTVAATAVGAASRVLVMTVVNGVFLPYGYPIGFNIPVAALPGILALIAVFNATLVVYTVPLSYAILRAVYTRFSFTPAYKVASLSPSSVGS
jgi:riboflavin transporter FmnP